MTKLTPDGEPRKQSDTGPIFIAIESVKSEPLAWLWEPFLPLGKLTILDGDPGVGKSWLTLAIARDVSLGAGMPGRENEAKEPRNVLLLNAEDGLGDTVRPRLEGMGADLSRIKALNASLICDEAGLAELESEVAIFRPALVIVDPLVAFM